VNRKRTVIEPRALWSLHGLGSEHDCVRLTSERWGILGNGPHHGPEELSECERGLVGVELEIDHDEARVVQWSQHAMGPHTCIAAGVTELVERGRPGLEVADRVLDVKCGHERTVRPSPFPMYPKKLGFALSLRA
jgi:hypothetical protein